MPSLFDRLLSNVWPELWDLRADVTALQRQGGVMAGELDRLQTEVTENKSAIDGAIVLLNQLAQLIRDNVNNGPALSKLADDLDAQSKALAAAVVANTPAEPEPDPGE